MSRTPGNHRRAVSLWLRTKRLAWRSAAPFVVGLRRTSPTRLDEVLAFDHVR